MWILRKLLHPMEELGAMEFLLERLKATKSNADFFEAMKPLSRQAAPFSKTRAGRPSGGSSRRRPVFLMPPCYSRLTA